GLERIANLSVDDILRLPGAEIGVGRDVTLEVRRAEIRDEGSVPRAIPLAHPRGESVALVVERDIGNLPGKTGDRRRAGSRAPGLDLAVGVGPAHDEPETTDVF